LGKGRVNGGDIFMTTCLNSITRTRAEKGKLISFTSRATCVLIFSKAPPSYSLMNKVLSAMNMHARSSVSAPPHRLKVSGGFAVTQ